MEAQEFGEMMEHVDEVNFALDGLRKGQPARIRRASLLSLLSICGTVQQRRLLRTQGYVNFEDFCNGFSVKMRFLIYVGLFCMWGCADFQFWFGNGLGSWIDLFRYVVYGMFLLGYAFAGLWDFEIYVRGIWVSSFIDGWV
jgi:hypothetical protein